MPGLRLALRGHSIMFLDRRSDPHLPSNGMTLRVDTDHLRRILTASLPSGTRAAELFIESRISVKLSVSPAPGGTGLVTRVVRGWETGAHLRRFSEGRHESFVLDAPTPESLEALCLHPEAIEKEWLTRAAPLGVPIEADNATRVEATLSDASPSSSAGPWSAGFLDSAEELARTWVDALAAAVAADAGDDRSVGGTLEASLQEILVLTTDRDPARDTRSFIDMTLTARGRGTTLREIRSASTLEGLSRQTGSGAPPAQLAARLARQEDRSASPSGEMPVVFASPSGGFLLHEVCGHLLEADHVLRGASPFTGARGRVIASPLLTLADDGSIPGMRGSTLFDDEGVAARRTPLIMEGILVGYLSDRMTSIVTDGISTGNGRRASYRDAPMPRMTNLFIEPRDGGCDGILSATPRGLLVTRLGRGRVEPATGRFVLAVEEGYAIEAGRRGRMVNGVVLRGTASDLLHAIDAVGADAAADEGAPVCIKEDQALPFGILQPTLRVASMTVSAG